MFIAALFTTAKIWKQLICPSINEWIKMWYMYMYSGILFSYEKGNLICNNIILSEISQTKKDIRCYQSLGIEK